MAMAVTSLILEMFQCLKNQKGNWSSGCGLYDYVNKSHIHINVSTEVASGL